MRNIGSRSLEETSGNIRDDNKIYVQEYHPFCESCASNHFPQIFHPALLDCDILLSV